MQPTTSTTNGTPDGATAGATPGTRSDQAGRTRWTGSRVISVLAGAVLGFCSLVLLTVGGVAASIAADDGYVDLGAPEHTYRAHGYAITSDSANWRTEWFGSLGAVRIRVASAGSGPIFVGTAKPDGVHSYLRGVEHTTVHTKTGHGPRRTKHRGDAPSSPPAKALHWTARASGAGIQALHWDAQTAGQQILVAMNADGSPDVRARVVSSAVTIPALPWVAAGALAGGVILLAGAVVLVVRPIRRVRVR